MNSLISFSDLVFSDQKHPIADFSASSCISTEECAVTLMTSQDDCFSKLPSLNEALKSEGLPIEIDLDLKPVLCLPQIVGKETEEHKNEPLSLPPLAISRFEATESIKFKSLYLPDLHEHLLKKNIP